MLSLIAFVLVVGCLPFLALVFTSEKTWAKTTRDAAKVKAREKRLVRLCIIGIVLVIAALILNLVLGAVFE
jgi:ABC-type Fe3+ transport system permease subunit